MKKILISSFIFVLALILTSCNYHLVEKVEPVKPRFSGDYEVLQLRSIWAICAQTYAMKSPRTPPPMVAQICDCYVDEIRQMHNSKELSVLGKTEAEQMGATLIMQCNVSIMDKLGRQQGTKQGAAYRNKNTL
jgi:hypothetical protein